MVSITFVFHLYYYKLSIKDQNYNNENYLLDFKEPLQSGEILLFSIHDSNPRGKGQPGSIQSFQNALRMHIIHLDSNSHCGSLSIMSPGIILNTEPTFMHVRWKSDNSPREFELGFVKSRRCEFLHNDARRYRIYYMMCTSWRVFQFLFSCWRRGRKTWIVIVLVFGLGLVVALKSFVDVRYCGKIWWLLWNIQGCLKGVFSW